MKRRRIFIPSSIYGGCFQFIIEVLCVFVAFAYYFWGSKDDATFWMVCAIYNLLSTKL